MSLLTFTRSVVAVIFAVAASINVGAAAYPVGDDIVLSNPVSHTNTPIFKPATAPAIRAGLKPSDLVFDLKSAIQVPGDGVLLEFGDLSSFRALALPDVQMSLARVTLDDGATNPTHNHPRGTELLYLTKGTLDVFISAEVGNGMISNRVETGQATTFPMGVPHGQKCVRGPCEFIAILNSADPGAVGPITVG